MEIIRGMVVCSKAGRDKDCFLVLMDTDGEYASICDGKYRPLSNPKKKNLKHLSLTGTVLEEDSMETNCGLRKALKKFNDNKA